jgi:glycerol-3-phosphate acyltransferase PlsX
MDPSEYGAAPLLGIDGMVFIGHGRSNARAMLNAIRMARQAVESGVLDGLRSAIQSQLSTSDVKVSS